MRLLLHLASGRARFESRVSSPRFSCVCTFVVVIELLLLLSVFFSSTFPFSLLSEWPVPFPNRPIPPVPFPFIQLTIPSLPFPHCISLHSRLIGSASSCSNLLFHSPRPCLDPSALSSSCHFHLPTPLLLFSFPVFFFDYIRTPPLGILHSSTVLFSSIHFMPTA